MKIPPLTLWRERLFRSLIGSPLEAPARRLRALAALPKRLRHPELREVAAEGRRIEALFATMIRDGMNCVDVGAHLGTVLSRFCRLSPSGRHVAIEPIPYKARWIQEKYPGVLVFDVAASDHAADVLFEFDLRRSGYSGLRGAAPPPAGGKHVFQVRTCRIDDLLTPDHRVDFLKIDVEGAELLALRGARETLRRWRPPILLECTMSCLGRLGIAPEAVHAFFTEEAGYRLLLVKDFLAAREPLDPARFFRAMTYPFDAFNFVAVPAGGEG